MVYIGTTQRNSPVKVMLRSSILWEKEHRDAGEVIEVSEIDAQWLIGRGRAVPYAEPQKPATNRAVDLETSEQPQKTVKRSWKKKTADSE